MRVELLLSTTSSYVLVVGILIFFSDHLTRNALRVLLYLFFIALVFLSQFSNFLHHSKLSLRYTPGYVSIYIYWRDLNAIVLAVVFGERWVSAFESCDTLEPARAGERGHPCGVHQAELFPEKLLRLDLVETISDCVFRVASNTINLQRSSEILASGFLFLKCKQ